MPGFDGTGPAGGGPITGGGRGYCIAGAPYGSGRPYSGRGFGFGYGSGRGYRHRYWESGMPLWARRRGDWQVTGSYRQPIYPPEEEVSMLKTEAKILKDDMNAIERRIKELEAQI